MVSSTGGLPFEAARLRRGAAGALADALTGRGTLLGSRRKRAAALARAGSGSTIATTLRRTRSATAAEFENNDLKATFLALPLIERQLILEGFGAADQFDLAVVDGNDRRAWK
jgi:hypothetical protein